jgi:hypothetical protein
MAVSYFGQIEVVWYLLLAAIGSLSLVPASVRVKRVAVTASEVRASKARRRPVPRPDRLPDPGWLAFPSPAHD